MSLSRCLVCGLPTDSVAESGLCVTCREASDETRRLDAEAGTRTQDAPEAGTQNYGSESGFGVLPPGGYRYEEKIGSGGMGVVWRAVRVSTDQVVAVKKLRPECFTEALLRRFVAEARTLATMDHPNVVRLQDFVPDPADPFLVLEFVPGESLAHHLKTVGTLHPDRAARLIGEAAAGVQAAHTVGVIHRDLKPGNLLLTPDGRVKVVDFGLSKQVAEVEVAAPTLATVGGGSTLPSQSLTAAGRMAGGTPGFMAPEQVDESVGVVGPATDVWGLGATLHSLLIGKPPFPPGKENLERVLTDQLIPLHELNPAIPVELSAIVLKCLQKKPADRYPSAADLAADLACYATGESTTARPKPWLTRAWRRVRRAPKAAVIAVAVAVLAVAIGGSLAMVPWRKDDPLTAVQKKLAAGEEVVLVDDGKFLLPPTWLLADAVLTEPTADEPYSSFATRQRAMLVVLPDLGIDRYRIVADLQQVPVDEKNLVAPAIKKIAGSAGVFWGYREAALPEGFKAKAYMTLDFNDYQPNPDKPRKTYLAHRHFGVVESPLELFPENQTDRPGRENDVEPIPTGEMSSAHDKLPFVRTLPGPTHRLTVDVTPDELAFEFPTGRRPLPPAELASDLARLETKLSAQAGRPLNTQNWSPRSPVGVFADRTRVAVVRFVIQPLPPK